MNEESSLHIWLTVVVLYAVVLSGNSVEGLNLLWVLIPFCKCVLVSFSSSRKIGLCLGEELYGFFCSKSSWVNVIGKLAGLVWDKLCF